MKTGYKRCLFAEEFIFLFSFMRLIDQQLLFFLLLTITFIRASIANVSMVLMLFWLKRSLLSVGKNTKKRFIIIIPVLREQRIIRKTVNHFLNTDYPKDKLTLLIVTTEREFAQSKQDEVTSETTITVVDRLKKEANEAYGKEIVQSIHYPGVQGKMVDQLNYAFDHVLEFFPSDKKNLFVAIYNADSKPNKKTFAVVSEISSQNNGRVFQQSALFFDNWHQIGKSKSFFEAKYLQANAVLQSRWTLAHEMPRFFRQSYFLKRWRMRMFLSHCVGHGLFLRGDLLEETRKMPTGTLTEDLFFGYVLSLLGESIRPIPVIEMAETPSTFLDSLKQKYVWFFGPLDHFHYDRYFSLHYPDKASGFLRKWFVMQGIMPAFIWMIQGWIFLYLFLYPGISGQYHFLWLSLTVFLFHSPLSYGIMLANYSFLARACSKKDRIRWTEQLWCLLFAFPAVVIHGMPPLVSVYAKTKQYLIGKEPHKPKTER